MYLHINQVLILHQPPWFTNPNNFCSSPVKDEAEEEDEGNGVDDGDDKDDDEKDGDKDDEKVGDGDKKDWDGDDKGVSNGFWEFLFPKNWLTWITKFNKLLLELEGFENSSVLNTSLGMFLKFVFLKMISRSVVFSISLISSFA